MCHFYQAGLVAVPARCEDNIALWLSAETAEVETAVCRDRARWGD
jgi:hypothetical protein